MANKNFAFPAVLVVLMGLGLCITLYFLTASSEKVASHEASPAKHAAPAKGSADKNQPSLQAEPSEEKPDLEEQVRQPHAHTDNSPNPPEANPELDQAMRAQVPFLYEDLFKELALPEPQRKQVENHLLKTMKAEAEFQMKLLDPKVSVEQLLKDQDRLSHDLQGELGAILPAREQDLLGKYQNELPKKRQQKQILMLVDNLNFQPAEKENMKVALEQAWQKNMEAEKSLGQYTEQDINDLRKPFSGVQPGDPEFMKRSVEETTKRVNGLLKELEHLPKDQYDALKKQIEMPLEMMRQGLKQHEQQG